MISIPPNSYKLKIQIFNDICDADLYVKYGALPDLNNFDRRPYLAGNDELVVIDNPQSGDWYIMLYAYNSYSGLTLSVNYSIDLSATKPSPPRNLNIIGVFNKEVWKAGVYLTWEPTSSDGGSSITDYRMYRKNEGVSNKVFLT